MLFGVGGLGATGRPDTPLPAVDALMQRFRDGLRSNPELFGPYKMRQRIIRREREGDGRVKRTTNKVYEVRPNAWGAPAQWTLLVEDGKPLPDERVRAARRKARPPRPLSERARARARAEAEEWRRETEEEIDDVFRVTEPTVVGRETIDGHTTIEVAFAPRPGARPSTNLGRIMAKTAGRIWLNEADDQLVRFEAEAIDTILYGWGFVARVHKGTRLEFTRRYVDESAWLPASYHLTGSVRMLLVRRRQLDSTSEFFAYERLDAGAQGASR